jgi:hypothetical protein
MRRQTPTAQSRTSVVPAPASHPANKVADAESPLPPDHRRQHEEQQQGRLHRHRLFPARLTAIFCDVGIRSCGLPAAHEPGGEQQRRQAGRCREGRVLPDGLTGEPERDAEHSQPRDGCSRHEGHSDQPFSIIAAFQAAETSSISRSDRQTWVSGDRRTQSATPSPKVREQHEPRDLASLRQGPHGFQLPRQAVPEFALGSRVHGGEDGTPCRDDGPSRQIHVTAGVVTAFVRVPRRGRPRRTRWLHGMFRAVGYPSRRQPCPR